MLPPSPQRKSAVIQSCVPTRRLKLYNIVIIIVLCVCGPSHVTRIIHVIMGPGGKRSRRSQRRQRITNASATLSCHPSSVHRPKSVDEIRSIVRQARTEGRRICTVGRIDRSASASAASASAWPWSGSSGSLGTARIDGTWSPLSLCDDGDVIISMEKYNQVVSLDVTDRTMTVQAGCTLDDIVPTLRRERMALCCGVGGGGEGMSHTSRSFGDLAAVAALGSCCGGIGDGRRQERRQRQGQRQGKGRGQGQRIEVDSFRDHVLSYKVCDLTHNVKVHTIRCDDDRDVFNAFASHLGLLAIVLEVTIQLTAWYDLKLTVRDVGSSSNLKLDRIQRRMDGFGVFGVRYAYFPSTDQTVEVVRERVDDDGAIAAAGKRKGDVRADFDNALRLGNSTLLRKCCPSCGEPYADVQKRALLSLSGNSDEWSSVPSLGDLWGEARPDLDHRMEYACPFDKTLVALKLIRDALEEKARKIPSVVTIRFCRGSKGLMAPHYSTASSDIFAYIEVRLRTRNINPLIPLVMQNELSKRGCRAHWAKENSTTYDLIASYQLWPASNLNTFLDIKSQYDPDGLLGNAYTDSIFSRGKPGAITIVENGNVHTIISVDDEEQEANPIAIMALPPHGTHKSGAIIPVEDGMIATRINMAEC